MAMSARFVEISREAIVAMLVRSGFAPVPKNAYNRELVYFRRHQRDANVLIKVYTSFSIEEMFQTARPCGGDAIRVVAVFDDGRKNFGICKMKRVFRTGTETGVIERTYTRMREAYGFVNTWLDTAPSQRHALKRPGQE